MDIRELLEKLLEETYLLSSALEAKNMDMVLSVLERRETLVKVVSSLNLREMDEKSRKILVKFNEENRLCMDKINNLRQEMNQELNQVKAEKNKTIRKQKVHDSYSNPYVGSVGTSFDLKK